MAVPPRPDVAMPTSSARSAVPTTRSDPQSPRAAVPPGPSSASGGIDARPASAGLRPHAQAAIAAWLAGFDVATRPVGLAAAFPRIADRIALLDGAPELAVRYLEKLMIDDRGGRDGFPVEIARELMRLRVHYGDRAGVPGCHALPHWCTRVPCGLACSSPSIGQV